MKIDPDKSDLSKGWIQSSTVTGTWPIACENRTTAGGTYISHKPGDGEGINNQNRKIKLRFNN